MKPHVPAAELMTLSLTASMPAFRDYFAYHADATIRHGETDSTLE
jgi:hypothetical protein